MPKARRRYGMDDPADQKVPEPLIKVQRFKLENGREGSYAPMGNGLIKILYDDGDMVIAREMGEARSNPGSDEQIPF